MTSARATGRPWSEIRVLPDALLAVPGHGAPMTQENRSPRASAAPSASAGFTGCFIGCAEPDPLIGLLWAGITVILLAQSVV